MSNRDDWRDEVSVLLRFFEHRHLPIVLQDIAKPFYDLAHEIGKKSIFCMQDVKCLEKLIEAKDCAVRAMLPQAPSKALIEVLNPTTGWLVEGPMDPDGQTYLKCDEGLSYEWTVHSEEALRLAREVDAMAVYAMAEYLFSKDPTAAPERVAEHEWTA